MKKLLRRGSAQVLRRGSAQVLRQGSARVLRRGSAQAWKINPLQKLFGDKGARERWEVNLVWFRLRYLEADSLTRCLNLLSRPQACERVALWYQPDEVVSRLYLGVPGTHARLLQRMAADFDFSLKPLSPVTAIPAIQKMVAIPDLPWDRPFLAHIVDSSLFLHVDDGDARVELGRNSRFLPDSKLSVTDVIWRLPTEPPAGLTQRLSWNASIELCRSGCLQDGDVDGENAHYPPAHLIATAPDSRRWLLGRSGDGTPLHVAGRVNIYGRQEAVAEWLVHQVTQMISNDPANLIIIDGAGDLVPRLKRKAVVTRLLGGQLAYVDIDGASLADGFNPLAAVPGETDAGTAERWQRWFQGMNVPAQGIRLLPDAQKDGVMDIPSLRKWLKGAERKGQTPQAASASYSSQAVSSLNAALNRLTANRSLREWLEWPTKSFDGLPESALFFACKGTGWDREQLLRSVLLAGLSGEGIRLIVHGFSWQQADIEILAHHEQVVIGNGPPLPDSTIVLTESHPRGEAAIADRFLTGNTLLQENLSLLTRGEGIILADERVLFTSWNGSKSVMSATNG